MRLGILVHVRGVQLGNKRERASQVTCAAGAERAGIQNAEGLLLCLTPAQEPACAWGGGSSRWGGI